MDYRFIPMNKEYANEIAYNWKYDGIYSFYDMTADQDDLKEFLREENWVDHYFAVLNDENELVGFYSFHFEDQVMWIGFGLKPELTGRGLGPQFITAGIEFGLKKYNYEGPFMMLAVALFNKRAIKVYERIGFRLEGKYIQKTNGREFEFVRMKKYID